MGKAEFTPSRIPTKQPGEVHNQWIRVGTSESVSVTEADGRAPGKLC